MQYYWVFSYTDSNHKTKFDFGYFHNEFPPKDYKIHYENLSFDEALSLALNLRDISEILND